MMDEEDLSAGSILKQVNFIAESKMGYPNFFNHARHILLVVAGRLTALWLIRRWIAWRETEAELYYFFERNFKTQKCTLKLTPDEGVFGIELEVPLDVLPRFEKAFKGTSM